MEAKAINVSLDMTEGLLFELFTKKVKVSEVPLLFILGSPRTGSTVIYQLLINYIKPFYFSNFIEEHFATSPALGAVFERVLNPRLPVSYNSAYGKTEGLWEPSEASMVFRHWFGGDHPSQIKSCNVLPGQEFHLLATMQTIYGLMGRMIVTKNAWNCFRIEALTRLFPRAHFLWIRRDIGLSALSDLKARYVRGGPTVWNSATTANYQEIQKMPYWEQVVEQQYEYNRSIAANLEKFSRGQFFELWYEELCDSPETQLDRLQSYFIEHNEPIELTRNASPVLQCSQGERDRGQDYTKIRHYINQHKKRFQSHVYVASRGNHWSFSPDTGLPGIRTDLNR